MRDRCGRGHQDGAHNGDVLAVVDLPFNVIDQKVTVRIEIANIPVSGLLLLRRTAQIPHVELIARPRQAFPSQLFIESAVCRYVLVVRHPL